MLRIVDVKLIKGVRTKTGKIFRICNRCGFKLIEDEYQKWTNYLQKQKVINRTVKY
jgi:hypothetical protein